MYSFDPVTGSIVPFTATWYVCPSGALPIGIPHQYASSTWTKGTNYGEQIGEILTAAKAYSKGATPANLYGNSHCGSAWEGKLERMTSPIPSRSDGQPRCCGPVLVPCSYCMGGKGPQVYTITASGGTGDFAAANVTVTVASSTPCLWQSASSVPYLWQLSNGGGFRVLWNQVSPPRSATWSAPAGWNCFGPITTWPPLSHSGSGTPPSITVSY